MSEKGWEDLRQAWRHLLDVIIVLETVRVRKEIDRAAVEGIVPNDVARSILADAVQRVLQRVMLVAKAAFYEGITSEEKRAEIEKTIYDETTRAAVAAFESFLIGKE